MRKFYFAEEPFAVASLVVGASLAVKLFAVGILESASLVDSLPCFDDTDSNEDSILGSSPVHFVMKNNSLASSELMDFETQ